MDLVATVHGRVAIEFLSPWELQRKEYVEGAARETGQWPFDNRLSKNPRSVPLERRACKLLFLDGMVHFAVPSFVGTSSCYTVLLAIRFIYPGLCKIRCFTHATLRSLWRYVVRRMGFTSGRVREPTIYSTRPVFYTRDWSFPFPAQLLVDARGCSAGMGR